jgi:hypothetical protein
MAKPTQKSLELAELVRRSDAARIQITQAHLELRRKLEVPLRIRDSLKSSPLKWIGGSLGIGFISSLLFRHRRSESKHSHEKKHRGWFVGSLMMIFNLVKPSLKVYATKLLTDYLQNQLSGRLSGSVRNDHHDPY